MLYLGVDLLYLFTKFAGLRKYVYSGVTTFEFILFTSFIYLNIKSTSFRKLIIFASTLFLIYIVFYMVNIEFDRLDSVPIGIETILILIFSFCYLYEQMNNTTVMFIYSQYQFWIIVGFMVYLSGSLFIYLFVNQLPKEQIVEYWFIVDIFLILKNIFFLAGILIHVFKQNKKTPPRMPTFKAVL